MIPDYTPPEGWRVVNYRDLPYNAVYTDDDEAEVRRKSHSTGDGYIGPVLVRVDPPFNFTKWLYSLSPGDLPDCAYWRDIEPVAEHVQLRDPTADEWWNADSPVVSDWDPSADAVFEVADAAFEVREKT
jgi:hypothetical protein